MTTSTSPVAAPSASDPAPPLVEIRHLVKEFPVTAGAVLQRKIGSIKAVTDVSFTIGKGETFGLVGESGSGKTTVGRLLVGLEKPTSGAVTFTGEGISQPGRTGSARPSGQVQMMFQDSSAALDPRMSVADLVAEPLAVKRVGTRRERRRKVLELLDAVGLPGSAADRHAHEFSGGQRQRIATARALVLRPRVIVADEPVSALDVSIQAQIINLMRS